MWGVVAGVLFGLSFDFEGEGRKAPPGWRAGGRAFFKWERGVASSGVRSLRISSSRGAAWWESEPVRARPSWEFLLTASCATSRATGSTYACLSWFDRKGRWVGSSVSPILSGDNGWTSLVVADRPPKGAVSLKIVLRSDGNRGDAWFDEVRLTAIEPERIPLNLAPNPSFEDVRGGRPLGWEPEGRARFYVAEGEGRTGRNALCIEGSVKEGGGWENAGWRTTHFPAFRRKIYAASCWAKLEGAGGRTHLLIAWFDRKGRWLRNTEGDFFLSGTCDWTRLSVSGTPPEGARFGRLYLRSDGNPGRALFDDVNLFVCDALLSPVSVPNSSFEEVARQPTLLLPVNWNFWRLEGSGRVALDSRTGRTGKVSALVADVRGDVGFESPEFWADGSCLYRLSCWAMSSGRGERAFACVAWFGRKGWLENSESFPLTGPTRGWVKLSVLGRPPKGAERGRIYLRARNFEGSVRFDDVSLEKVFPPAGEAAKIPTEEAMAKVFLALGRGLPLSAIEGRLGALRRLLEGRPDLGKGPLGATRRALENTFSFFKDLERYQHAGPPRLTVSVGTGRRKVRSRERFKVSVVVMNEGERPAYILKVRPILKAGGRDVTERFLLEPLFTGLRMVREGEGQIFDFEVEVPDDAPAGEVEVGAEVRFLDWAKNLVFNPSFEALDGLEPSGWTLWGSDERLHFEHEVEVGEGPIGGQCLLFRIEGSECDHGVMTADTREVEVSPGEPLECGVALRSDRHGLGSPLEKELVALELDEKGKVLREHHKHLYELPWWDGERLRFVTGKKTRKVRLSLRMSAFGKGRKGTCLWDLAYLARQRDIEECFATERATVSVLPSPAGERLLYLGEDRKTKGNWMGRYGTFSYTLCTANLDGSDVVGGFPVVYEVATGDPKVKRAKFIGAHETSDERALWNPARCCRTYACWDDQGEKHPFDSKGPDLVVRLRIPSGVYRLALYFVDWDWWNTDRPRRYGILVEAGGERLLLSTGKVGGGVYKVVAVRGPVDLTVRVMKRRSACASISGVFLDEIGPLPPPALPSKFGLDLGKALGRALGREVAPWEFARRLVELRARLEQALSRGGELGEADRLAALWLLSEACWNSLDFEEAGRWRRKFWLELESALLRRGASEEEVASLLLDEARRLELVRFEDALRLYDRLADRFPKFAARAREAEGEALLRAGMREEARKALKEALRLSPPPSEVGRRAAFWLGVLDITGKEGEGNFRRAKGAFEAALKGGRPKDEVVFAPDYLTMIEGWFFLPHEERKLVISEGVLKR